MRGVAKGKEREGRDHRGGECNVVHVYRGEGILSEVDGTMYEGW